MTTSYALLADSGYGQRMTITRIEQPSRLVAAEVRAEMARQGVSQRDLAARMSKPQPWVSRRLSMKASATSVDLTFEDVVSMAEALGVSPQGFLAAWLPRLDSNQQPSGYPSPQVSDDDDWVLAA